MTLEQKRAVAMASARLRLPPEKFVPSGERQTPSWTDPETIAGNPVTRFALGAANPFLGAAQLGANVQDRLYALTGIPFRPGEAMNDYLGRLERMKQEGRATLGSKGFDVTEAAGTVLSPGFLKAGQALPAATTVAGRAKQGAAIGGVAGATAPVSKPEDYWSTKGAQTLLGVITGGLIPPAIDLAKGVGKAAYSAVEPVFEKGRAAILKRYQDYLLGADKPQAVAALRQAGQLVPGSRPTAAEAVAEIPGASPLAAHQRAVAGTPEVSGQFIARDRAQEAARRAAVGTVAQDKAALKAAEGTRSSAAARNYGAVAGDIAVPVQNGKAVVDKTMGAILSRPSMEKAVKRAEELTAEQGGTWPGAAGGYTVKNMQNVKMALDDMLKNPEQYGIGASETKAIAATRIQFVQWLNGKSPGWQYAREAYQRASEPINQMQVGQYLENKLTAPLGTTERAASFSQAVRDAPGTIKRATGAPRYEELSEVLTPVQETAVRGVMADLARSARADQLAKGTNLSGATDIVAGQRGPHLPNLLSRPAMIANFIMRKLGEGADQKINRLAGEQYLDPLKLAKALEAVPAPVRGAVVQELIKLGRVPVFAGAIQEAAKQ